MARITINGITLDPMAATATLATVGAKVPTAADTNYVLIQARKPLGKNERSKLASLGVKLLEFVPELTYIARFGGDDLHSIEALPEVEWAGPYFKEFKISPSLLLGPQSKAVEEFAVVARTPMPSIADKPLVDIILHDDVDPSAVKQRIALAAGLDLPNLSVARHRIRAHVDALRLSALREFDEIKQIEEVYTPEFSNDVAGRILRVDAVHLHNTPYRGAEQVIAICDTGFDKGVTTNVHPAFTNRVRHIYNLGRTSGDDPDGHGTHVAGSALGDGLLPDGLPIRGSAPGAQLVMQSVLDSSGGLGGLPSDLNNLFHPTYSNDAARIHNNSWGSLGSNGKYTAFSNDVDEFVWNNRDFVICFAAGNPGIDMNENGVIDLGSVQAPGTAKNCITVGACESLRPTISKRWGAVWPSRFPINPIKDDLWADNENGMAAFSGRGPTRDGRIKPDLVAPGTSILSACSRNAQADPFWGPPPSLEYCYNGGTSMAAPLVSGCAALVREFLQKKHGIMSPSAALIKALLINGCEDLQGQYVPTEAGPPPNFSEGFGRVNVEHTLALLPGMKLELFDEAVMLDTDDDEQKTIDIGPSVRALKATLVWTDPPGASLQNDLDLAIRFSDLSERHGNVAAGSSDFDRTNNVEQVFQASPAQGSATITVRAHRVALQPQSFALVVRTW